MDAELKAYLDSMREELMAHSGQLNQETRRDLMTHAEQLNRETRQHAEQINRETGILVEDLHTKIQLVAEGVSAANEKLDRFRDEVQTQIDQLDRRVMRLEAKQR